MLAFVMGCYFMAELNYAKAIKAAKSSEGTDLAIESTMAQYGFKKAWHEEITLLDKVSALLN